MFGEKRAYLQVPYCEKKIQTPSLLGNHPNLEMDKKAIEYRVE